MMGLSCLWSNLMRGNLGRHGNNIAYKDWEAKYASLPCITNVTRTQGLIEKHNDSLKHVYLNKKNARLDVVVQNLYGVHFSIKRQFEIETSRQTPNSNKSTGAERLFPLPQERFKIKSVLE